MALVSLKREPDDYPTEYFENHFGYCTEISLDREQCEKLGITKPMRVGQPVNIRAAGIVVSSSEYLEANTDSGHKDVTVRIQLTEIDVTPTGTASPQKAAALLYGKEE